MTAKVSVIIPVYNARDIIGEAIAAVLARSYSGPFELVVVDDGSSDGTADVVRSFPGVRYFFQENKGPASARNRGAAEATGDILFFTDADCCPEPAWIDKMMKGFNDPAVGAVAGSYGIANPQDMLARIIHAEIRFRHLKLMPEYPRAFGSYNFALPAALFRQLGGFNCAYRQASGEDNDLSYRLLRSGKTIRFMKDACVAHYHQTSLGKYLREQFRHGFWRIRLYRDHLSMAAGDDYTFWKDIAEVPLVAVQLACLSYLPAFWWLLSGSILFETVAGLWMLGLSRDGFYAGMVWWLRSFARCAGFFSGGIFFLRNDLERVKKT